MFPIPTIVPAAIGIAGAAYLALQNASPKTKKLIVQGGIALVGTGVAVYYGKKYLEKAKKDNALSQYGTDTPQGRAVEFATRFYSAMVSGYEWVNDIFGDGTNEEAIYEVAKEMKATGTSLSQVSKEYRTLYGRELFTDLQKELDSEEMQEFNRNLTGGLGSLPIALVTVVASKVFDEWLKPVQQVPAGTLLPSAPTGTLSGQGGNYVAFNYNGQTRYIAKSDIVKTYG